MARDFGTQQGNAALNNQEVDYREIRTGAGARYALGRALTVEVEGGWMIDRRFDFHERGLLLNGDGAPYVSAFLNFSF